jgi:hypothetical protein
LFRRHGFLVLGKIVKTLEEKDDVIENIRWSAILSSSCDKGFARGKGRSRKIMGSTIVFDVLLQTIKELPMLFRNRGSERFDRGELGGEGFGRGHNDTHSVSSAKDKIHSALPCPKKTFWLH